MCVKMILLGRGYQWGGYYSLYIPGNSSCPDVTQYFGQQPRKWSEIFTDVIKIGEDAKDEEALCQCGLKPANSWSIKKNTLARTK